MRNRHAMVALLATVALASAACGKSSSGTTNSPTPAGNTNNTIPPTGVIEPTATLGSGGTLPTTTPGGATGGFNSGAAQVTEFTGSEKTAPDLVLTFGVLSSSTGGFEQFTSRQGECTVTLDNAEAGNVTGSFQCSGVMGSNGTAADASGTFGATA